MVNGIPFIAPSPKQLIKMKNKTLNRLFVASVILYLGVTATAFSAIIPKKAYPKNFIPFWSEQKKGYETTLLNTNQIVRIVPVFDPKKEKPTHNDIMYLTVYLVDGNTLTVEEDFDEFYTRVRVSQAR